MTEIAIGELARHSPWPDRLANGTAREPRTPASVQREYGRDKYGSLLAALEAGEIAHGVDDVKWAELGDRDALTVMSIGDRLYLTTVEDAFVRGLRALLDRMDPLLDGAEALVDLGCGYGYHLEQIVTSVQDPGWIAGGEVTPEGVELGLTLGMPVEHADLLTGDVGPLDGAPEPVVVLLNHTLHQLPSAAPAVDALAPYRDAISRVVVFDALAGAHTGDDELTRLRRRYVEFNAYSWDLLEVLGARDDVVLETLEPNVIGANALLPSSLAVWRFET